MIEDEHSHLANLDVWKQWREQGNMKAKNELIEHYLSLVDYVAGRIAVGLPHTISRDDLSSYGIMGLMDAIDKFDYRRGLQFETYGTWRIRGAILDGLRQGDWVPRSIREKAKKIEEAYRTLEQQHVRSVTDKEISDYLNMTEDEFQQTIQDISNTAICSLDDPIQEEGSETRLAALIDETADNPDLSVHRIYIQEMLSKAIERLTDKERIVISLCYYEDLSLSEIADVMSLSASRISQLHSKAILRLRGSLSRSKRQLLEEPL